MEKPKFNQFPMLSPLTIQRYERYLPTAFDESMSLLEKSNKIIEFLNHVERLLGNFKDDWETFATYMIDYMENYELTINNKHNDFVEYWEDFVAKVYGGVLIWLEPVDVFEDLATTYPNAVEGNSAMVRNPSTGYGEVYRFTSGVWKLIQNLNTSAINEVEERFNSQLMEIVNDTTNSVVTTINKLLTKQTVSVVAVGDSLTFGRTTTSPAQVANPYPAVLQTKLRELYDYTEITVTNKGINGDTSGGVWNRLEADVINLDPDLCILQIGTNDAVLTGTITAYRNNLNNIIDKIKDNTIDLIVMIPPPLFATVNNIAAPQRLELIRNVIKQVCKDKKVTVIDNYEFLNAIYDSQIEFPYVIQNDDIHFIDGKYKYFVDNLIKNVFHHNVKLCKTGKEFIRFYQSARNNTPFFRSATSRLDDVAFKHGYVVYITKGVAGEYYKFYIFVDVSCTLNMLAAKTSDSGSVTVKVNGVSTTPIDLYSTTTNKNFATPVTQLKTGLNIIEVQESDLQITGGTTARHYLHEYYLT